MSFYIYLQMGKFWTSFGFTVMVSIALVLAYEAPIIALEKILFSRDVRRKGTESTMNLELEQMEKNENHV